MSSFLVLPGIPGSCSCKLGHLYFCLSQAWHKYVPCLSSLSEYKTLFQSSDIWTTYRFRVLHMTLEDRHSLSLNRRRMCTSASPGHLPGLSSTVQLSRHRVMSQMAYHARDWDSGGLHHLPRFALIVSICNTRAFALILSVSPSLVRSLALALQLSLRSTSWTVSEDRKRELVDSFRRFSSHSCGQACIHSLLILEPRRPGDMRAAKRWATTSSAGIVFARWRWTCRSLSQRSLPPSSSSCVRALR